MGGGEEAWDSVSSGYGHLLFVYLGLCLGSSYPIRIIALQGPLRLLALWWTQGCPLLLCILAKLFGASTASSLGTTTIQKVEAFGVEKTMDQRGRCQRGAWCLVSKCLLYLPARLWHSNDSGSPVMLLQHMPDYPFHTCHRGHCQIVFKAFYSESLISYCLVFVTKDHEERQVWSILPL